MAKSATYRAKVGAWAQGKKTFVNPSTGRRQNIDWRDEKGNLPKVTDADKKKFAGFGTRSGADALGKGRSMTSQPAPKASARTAPATAAARTPRGTPRPSFGRRG